MIFDAHTHIHFPEYDNDREEVIKRALSAGVKMVTVGTTLEDSELAIQWAEKYPDNIWATVGVHPTEIQSLKSKNQNYGLKLKTLAEQLSVVAVGECGLDYYRIGSYELEIKERQKKIFTEQIGLAQELQRPLMVHCRPSKDSDDAYDDLISIIHNFPPKAGQPWAEKPTIPKIIHFFVGSLQIAQKLLDLGCYFTFGGVITFARDYDEVIKFLPLENILLETDAPYVAPAPYRGKRNEPAYIIEVAKKLAEIKGLDYNAITRQTTENAKTIFNLKF